jgi:prepilin signal peptidase PulO-like enzyme (type II secretory pathway)
MDPQFIDILRAVSILIGLGLASFYDYKYREIPDYIWNVLFGVGAVLLSIELIWTVLPEQLLIQAAANVLFAVGLGWSLYLYLGWQFGGADVKALTAISILIPAPLSLGLGTYWISVMPPFDFIFPLPIVVVLTNSAAIGLLYVGNLLIVRTLRDGFDSDQPLVSLFSRKVDVDELTSYHGFITDLSVYPSYESRGAYTDYKIFTNNGIPTKFLRDYITWHSEHDETDYTSIKNISEWRVAEFIDSSDEYFLDPESELGSTPEEVVASLQEIVQKKEVYVTPGFPLIVFLFVGVIITIFVGDLFLLLFPF